MQTNITDIDPNTPLEPLQPFMMNTLAFTITSFKILKRAHDEYFAKGLFPTKSMRKKNLSKAVDQIVHGVLRLTDQEKTTALFLLKGWLNGDVKLSSIQKDYDYIREARIILKCLMMKTTLNGHSVTEDVINKHYIEMGFDLALQGKDGNENPL